MCQVDLHPWVLVSSNYDARSIPIKEENVGVCGRLLEEVMLDGEVEVRVVGIGDVDLTFVDRINDGFGEVLPFYAGDACISNWPKK